VIPVIPVIRRLGQVSGWGIAKYFQMDFGEDLHLKMAV